MVQSRSLILDNLEKNLKLFFAIFERFQRKYEQMGIENEKIRESH